MEEFKDDGDTITETTGSFVCPNGLLQNGEQLRARLKRVQRGITVCFVTKPNVLSMWGHIRNAKVSSIAATKKRKMAPKLNFGYRNKHTGVHPWARKVLC